MLVAFAPLITVIAKLITPLFNISEAKYHKYDVMKGFRDSVARFFSGGRTHTISHRCEKCTLVVIFSRQSSESLNT